MTTIPGTWRILNGYPTRSERGTPPGLRFFAMSPVRPGEGRQSPASSGLPSDVRGAGAVRLGLPSAVRGTFGVGTVSHCADAVELMAKAMAIAGIVIVRARIAFLPPPELFTLHFELYYFTFGTG